MHATLRAMLTAVAVSGFASGAAAQGEAAPIAEGARLWGDNCTRCHNARLASERSDAEWATIIAHMRARANLRKSEAEAITDFLQATNPGSRGLARAQEGTDEGPVGTRSAEGDAETLAAALSTLDRTQRAALLAYLRSLQRRGS